MLELAIWMYHIGNPDPVVRVITDVATSLVILWGVVNHYAKKESEHYEKNNAADTKHGSSQP